MKFSIIIPCFNEEENIENLILEIDKYLADQIKYEIIIVDDCSNKKTKDIILNIKSKTNLRLISNSQNMGQSYSIFKGIKNSRFENIITIDGDGQNDPIDIMKLINIYNTSTYGLVGGLRLKRKDNIIKRISSLFANYIRNLVLKDNCRDTGCSLKIFSKTIFMKMPYFDGIHRFLPALFKAYGCVTTFIPVNHRHRKFGTSNYGTFDRAIRGIRDLIKVYFLIRKLKND